MRKDVVINGRFLTQRPTGVHRVAEQLVLHLDQLLQEFGEEDATGTWSIATPAGTERKLPLRAIKTAKPGHLSWQAWEQLELPRVAKGRLLVNLCNVGPLFTPGAVTFIHDAQVFITPASNKPLFTAWYKFLLPKLGAGAARIVTVSDFSRASLAQHKVAPRHKIDVIPNGAEHMLTAAADARILDRIGAREGFVFAAANTQAHKNIRVLFQAAEQGLDRQIVLAGPQGHAEFTAAGLIPPPNVVFAGFVTDGEMRSLYEAAGCLAFPSTTEGFGFPALEAMSLGCPCVVAPSGAIPEVCGDAALYASATDPAEWVRVINRICDDHALRKSMVARGRARAGQYTWASSARQLWSLINHLRDPMGASG